MREQTIALIDGHSLFHRAFFALPLLTNQKGQPTNAVYGFLTMLFKLLDDEAPACLAVAFDRAAPTFRHREFDAYKAHRPEMADELRSQGPLLREALAALHVPIYEMDGYEADDVLAMLARRAAAEGMNVILVSGDKDLLQLVGPRVRVVLTRKGISELESYDEAAVRERYGLSPAQLVDVKALMGDPSDNIPGVPGVGEKTALKLIQRFGSLEGVYAHIEEAGGPKLVETLAAHREQAEMSRRLAALVPDVPLEVDLAGCRRREPDGEAFRRLCEELGFRSLIQRLGLASGSPDAQAPEAPAVACRLVPVGEAEAAAAGLRQALAASPDGRLVLIGDEAASALAALPVTPGGPGQAFCFLDLQGALPALAPLLADPAVPKAGHDLKPLARLLRGRGQRLAGAEFDTAIAAYLLDATRSSYRLDDLSVQYLDMAVPPLPGAPAGRGRNGAEPVPLSPEEVAAALAARAGAVAGLRDRLATELADRGLDALFREIEMPLVPVLADMEAAGILVDPATLNELGREFTARAEDLAQEIYALAGEPFNINSPQQLGEVLFNRLGLPAEKKTKTGYSTDASVLEALAVRHPIAAKVLAYRHLVKLLGTYVDGLKAEIDPADGRVHCTFQQTVTATGRLSSTNPNLQNIPIREEQGRRLRRAFVASPGHLLLAADYSQIELRVLAHFSGDEGLVAAFRAGADIHRATAAEVYGVPPETVAPEMRNAAKAVNFGLVYGISDFGLAQNLGIGRAEARAFIAAYFEKFPGVRRYMDEVVARARRDGFVRTLFGRIRTLPEINSRNHARRQFAERTALNTPIQGTAADIMKAVMVRVHRDLAARSLAARLLLQVHDELILEVPEGEMGAARDLVVGAMEGAADLAVPLQVDVKEGPNWYDMR